MSCPVCGSSANQEEFSAEMMFHFRGMENLDRPGVMAFPRVLVCLECGFSQFTTAKMSLALLAKASPTVERFARSDC
jgi:predicted nucleic-acid-binding Zn-ribbon protein